MILGASSYCHPSHQVHVWLHPIEFLQQFDTETQKSMSLVVILTAAIPQTKVPFYHSHLKQLHHHRSGAKETIDKAFAVGIAMVIKMLEV